LEKLYTCLRVAASAKAGRYLMAFYYRLSKHNREVTLSEIARYP
jgi:hypothetical protein